MRMLDMANDSGLFKTRTQLESNSPVEAESNHRRNLPYLPLIEAKMVHHFDHRFGDYSDRPAEKEGTDTRNLPTVPLSRLMNAFYSPAPRYWVREQDVLSRINPRWSRQWILGWRDICRAIDQRTLIASLIPRAATGDTFLLAFPDVDLRLIPCFYACLCSFVLDYAARQKVGGTHLKYHTFKQLPVLAPTVFEEKPDWDNRAPVRDWVLTRVLELTYTAWDLRPFACDVGCDFPPFHWNPERRFHLRCELDAALFHLYLLNREDAAYVMDTFPVVRKNDEKAFGEYRTKRVILEVYDAMAEAIGTGSPYQTRLDPPPADSRCCHPPKH